MECRCGFVFRCSRERHNMKQREEPGQCGEGRDPDQPCEKTLHSSEMQAGIRSRPNFEGRDALLRVQAERQLGPTSRITTLLGILPDCLGELLRVPIAFASPLM